MVITVIGSLNKSEEEMIKIWNYFSKFDFISNVHIPCREDRKEKPILTNQEEWIDKIKEADLIIAIPKEEDLDYNCGHALLFGESTSYEIAIAHHFNKPVLYWGNIMYSFE